MVMKEGCHCGDFETKKNKKNFLRFLGFFFYFFNFFYFVTKFLNPTNIAIFHPLRPLSARSHFLYFFTAIIEQLHRSYISVVNIKQANPIPKTSLRGWPYRSQPTLQQRNRHDNTADPLMVQFFELFVNQKKQI
jgi:hypothetical protein